MMDQATNQQKRIYASFLSQIDWTKRLLVHKSHEKNWINFQNWIWRRNGSASFNLVFWILVVEIWILLMVNNNSTGATAWLDLVGIFESLEIRNPSLQGIPAGSLGSTGVWDPMESQTGILGSTGVWDPRALRVGNESQTRFPVREWILGLGSVWDCCWGSRGSDDGDEKWNRRSRRFTVQKIGITD